MKIKKVKYNNHPILGDLELNFVNPDTNIPYDTVVFLGENGTGKTTILNTLSGFQNCVSIKPFSYFEYEANGTSFRAEPLTEGYPCWFKRTKMDDGSSTEIHRDKNLNPNAMYSDVNDPRSYPCVVSKARADYSTKKITSSTTSTLDTEKHEADTKDDYTSLKQLMVDIANQDNQSFVDFNLRTGQNYAAFEQTSKMYRFKSAFNSFFTQMAFKKVVDKEGEKTILFEKNGSEISIDSLSTGEKQIVYRGAFLLKNSGNMDGGTAFVDEPELSMHPLWQKKILSYFKNLYTDAATNTQKAQMFFASHSDSVVIDALTDRTKTLVIVLTADHGSIIAKHITAPIVLSTVTNAEVNYHAFGLYTVDFHIALYGYLQALTNRHSVTGLDGYICAHPLYVGDAYHHRTTGHNGATYNSLTTSIRNNIDHPDNGNTFTYEELARSTELLISLINDWKVTHP